MKYYGVDISEEMVFGVGSGLYFLFTSLMKMEGFPHLVLRTKPSQIFRNASKRLGLSLHELTFGNNKDKAMSTLAELVDRDIPVTLVTNISHIPFLTPHFPGIFSLNGHYMIIIGRDGDRYTVADTNPNLPNDDYTYIDDADLRITRFMPGPYSPHGCLLYFDRPDPDIFQGYDFRPACIEGLKETCRIMLDVPFPYFGARGIHLMAKKVRGWKNKYPRHKLERTLFNYYRLLEQSGTGGSGYRYFYARFLSQCSELFQSEALSDSAESLTKAADAWRKFTLHVLHYRKKMEVTLGDMSDALEEASQYEYAAFHTIKKQFLKKIKI